MCRTEKIKHNLHWIESSERNLNKESIPLTHSTIPKTRKLESLKLATLIALRRNETCILIHILKKIEALTLIIMETANNINRIEVSS